MPRGSHRIARGCSFLACFPRSAGSCPYAPSAPLNAGPLLSLPLLPLLLRVPYTRSRLSRSADFSAALAAPGSVLYHLGGLREASVKALKRKSEVCLASVKSPNVVKSNKAGSLGLVMQFSVVLRQNLGQVAAFMAGFVACMLISRTQSGGFEGTFRCWTLRHL
jgi:uncharacterized membrane protein